MVRKAMSKKDRFEVFKRDSFKCQYCGESAPDVVLEVDHIKPVAEGGTNDLINLITSCFDCNRGKGKRLLDDNSVLEKQRKQLEEINEKRNQLEMMMEWRESLDSLDKEKINILKAKWLEFTGFNINGHGEPKIKQWMKKFEFNLLLDCMVISAEQYLKVDNDDEVTQESVEKAFKMIPRIAVNKQKDKEEPYMKDLYYIRGILRNRLHYYNSYQTIDYLKLVHVEAGYSIESLKDFALKVKNWTNFRSEMERALEEEGIDY